jgi:uncharacterized membrane protein (DUF485 family)
MSSTGIEIMISSVIILSAIIGYFWPSAFSDPRFNFNHVFGSIFVGLISAITTIMITLILTYVLKIKTE